MGGKLGRWWHEIEGMEAWSAFAAENITAEGEFSPLWATYPMDHVREIRGPNNILYGFVIYQRKMSISARLVEENTIWVWSYGGGEAGPAK